MSDIIIQPLPPQDGRDYDCQCARCGSSCESEGCDECLNDGFVTNDDRDWDDDEEFVTCPECLGTPVVYRCLSSADWCLANPLAGRENVERGKIEWFEIKEGGA